MATRKNEKTNNTGVVYLIIALVILLFGVIFALQNDYGVDIHFLGLTYTGSLALVLAVVFVSGIVLGLLVMMGNSIRQSRNIRHLNRDVDRLEEENQRLEKENAELYKSEHNKRKKDVDERGGVDPSTIP